MKRLFILAIITLVFASCSTDDSPITPTPDDTEITGDERQSNLDGFTYGQLRTVLIDGGVNAQWILDKIVTDNGNTLASDGTILAFSESSYTRSPLNDNRSYFLGQYAYDGAGNVVDEFNNLSDYPQSSVSSVNKFTFYLDVDDVKFYVISGNEYGSGNAEYHYKKY